MLIAFSGIDRHKQEKGRISDEHPFPKYLVDTNCWTIVVSPSDAQPQQENSMAVHLLRKHGWLHIGWLKKKKKNILHLFQPHLADGKNKKKKKKILGAFA